MKPKENEILDFVLVGTNPDLARSEVLSILRAESLEYEILPDENLILRLKIPKNTCKEVIKEIAVRTPMVKLIIKELRYSQIHDVHDLLDLIRKINFDFLTQKRFHVRIFKKGNTLSSMETPKIEAIIGDYIIKKVIHTKVDFKKPDLILVGILYKNTFAFGVLLKEIKRGYLLKWSPRKRPFFMSSALDVFTSRVMVNLSERKKNSIILDPFAGTGSILIDCGKIGCDVVGMDVKEHITRGCLKNLKLYIENERILGIILCDALLTPLRNNCIDAIVTDPPYGRSSTTLGRSLMNIYSNLVREAKRVLRKNAVLLMLYPDNLLDLENILTTYFLIEEKHLIRVHKKLVRVLIKARKVE